MELLGWQAPNQNDELKIRNFVTDCIVYPLSDDVVEKTIELRKKIKIKLPDAIIAATAIINNLTLISRNDKDFEKIIELNYLNPFTL